ncbi:chromosomal replication initiator protein DnaA [Candidatus Dojkabacteria bacterium]|uniref:Chromosomal replication initiator protein DnaA n=1 Tax=Candidatus Dojkabacteria bacterium TaxID=2099670 RepID=A0A847VE21_9BACT|nr:chromosomal replication initiator protein DnaA [Candidatus Dojkabacteria bacterium]
MDKIDIEKYSKSIPEVMIEEDISNSTNVNDVWKIVTENLRIVLDSVEYKSWFSDTQLLTIQNGIATVSCSNEFQRNTILSDYGKFLQNCFLKATGENLKVELVVKENGNEKKEDRYKYIEESDSPMGDLFAKMEDDKKRYVTAAKKASLNPRYTFDNFVVGSNNRLAEAVAQSVVSDIDNELIAKSYNPVFYYGSTGVGKTHLMQAIGNEILKKDPDKKVIYVSIEQFLNELIESIRTKKNEDFRLKYRDVNLLIIDDIQFVEAYPKTQEELFHTFNTLYQANKQIILASDRPPKEINNITDRLRTRFEGGMVSDIQPPEYETRLAILKQGTVEKGVTIPEIYLELIAKNIESSVRELEGALNKVLTLMKLGELPSYQEVAKILQVDLESKRKRATPEKVLQVVAEEFDVSVRYIRSSRKTANIALTRQVAMYILRTELQLPLLTVASAVGRKDHTTVLHGCKSVEEKMKKDSSLTDKIEKCKRDIFY